MWKKDKQSSINNNYLLPNGSLTIHSSMLIKVCLWKTALIIIYNSNNYLLNVCYKLNSSYFIQKYRIISNDFCHNDITAKYTTAQTIEYQYIYYVYILIGNLGFIKIRQQLVINCIMIPIPFIILSYKFNQSFKHLVRTLSM